MAERKSTSSKPRKKAPKRTSTKRPTRRKTTRRRKKQHFAPIIVGLLSVMLILMVVHFFIVPNLQTNDTVIVDREKPLPPAKDKTPTQPLPKTVKPQPKTPSPKDRTGKATNTTKPSNPPTRPRDEKDHRAQPTTTIPEQPTDTSLPALPQKGTLVFVFDDAGHSLSDLQAFLDLPFPCCIAVIPRLPKSLEAAKRIRKAKKELMLHQPMQAFNKNIDPGAGAVREGMNTDEIKTIVRKNIELLSPLAGMNNHEGSLITANKEAMHAVLEVAHEKNIFFLDSRTSAKTVVPEVASELHMPIWERGIFIDNDHSREAMKKEILKGIKIAEQRGYVIMIGHVFTLELAKLLKDMYPDFIAEGFSLSTITQLKEKGIQ